MNNQLQISVFCIKYSLIISINNVNKPGDFHANHKLKYNLNFMAIKCMKLYLPFLSLMSAGQ